MFTKQTCIQRLYIFPCSYNVYSTDVSHRAEQNYHPFRLYCRRFEVLFIDRLQSRLWLASTRMMRLALMSLLFNYATACYSVWSARVPPAEIPSGWGNLFTFLRRFWKSHQSCTRPFILGILITCMYVLNLVEIYIHRGWPSPTFFSACSSNLYRYSTIHPFHIKAG